MVILISAESCTGKTVMAQKLLEKYKIPYICIDHLKMGLFKSGIDYGFHPEDSTEKIESILWPILKGIVETNIENNQNIIIEGCYLLPQRIKELDEYYLNQVIPIFMGFSKNYIENCMDKIIAHRSDIENRGYSEERSMSQFVSENEKLKALCNEHSFRFFEITEDYEKDTTIIYQWIDAEITRLRCS